MSTSCSRTASSCSTRGLERVWGPAIRVKALPSMSTSCSRSPPFCSTWGLEEGAEPGLSMICARVPAVFCISSGRGVCTRGTTRRCQQQAGLHLAGQHLWQAKHGPRRDGSRAAQDLRAAEAAPCQGCPALARVPEQRVAACNRLRQRTWAMKEAACSSARARQARQEAI